jgi:hypothetical protein
MNQENREPQKTNKKKQKQPANSTEIAAASHNQSVRSVESVVPTVLAHQARPAGLVR